MAQASLKNAVMVVQELCVKSGKIPNYTEIQVTPPSTNPPVFRTTCEITFLGEVYTATADANTKKGAKLKACESLIYNSRLSAVLNMNDPDIRKIFGLVDRREESVLASPGSSLATTSAAKPKTRSSPEGSGENEPEKKQSRNMSENEEVTTLVVDILSDYAKDGNPIADLNVFCDKLGLSEPKYEDGPREGPPHRPTLSVTCCINTLDFVPLGIHMVKKTAKRIAAEKMLTELKRRVETGQIKMPKKNDSDEENVEETGLINLLSSSEEKLRTLSIADNNDSNTGATSTESPESDTDSPPFGKKTMNDFLNRSYLEKLRENEFANLRNMGGPRVTEMISFAEEVNEKFPLEGKPLEPFKAWLEVHELGISGFFTAIKDELQMKVDFLTLCQEEKENLHLGVSRYMVILQVEIPEIENRQPVVFKLDDNLESGKLNAMVELIMYLGLMTVGL